MGSRRLLGTAFGPLGDGFWVTLAPKGPQDRKRHQKCESWWLSGVPKGTSKSQCSRENLKKCEKSSSKNASCKSYQFWKDFVSILVPFVRPSVISGRPDMQSAHACAGFVRAFGFGLLELGMHFHFIFVVPGVQNGGKMGPQIPAWLILEAFYGHLGPTFGVSRFPRFFGRFPELPQISRPAKVEAIYVVSGPY